MSISMETVAQQIRESGWAPVALYGVSPGDGRFCHCSKGGSCPSKGKHPIETEWASRGFPTEQDVREMFTKHRTAQVGVRTGSVSGNLIVLDIDEGGREAIAPLVRANGGMPETLVVQTGSGGLHYYFTAPQGVVIPNSQSRVAQHVDIRGEGGQVVGPYARTDKGAYSVLHSAPVAPMPQWLIKAAAPVREKVQHVPASVTKRPQSAEEASYEQNMLNKQLGRLAALQNKPWEPGDAWDINCFEVACHLVELANSDWAAITRDQAYEAFMAAAPSDSRWDEREAKWAQALHTCGEKAKEGPKEAVGALMGAHEAAAPDFPQGAPAAPAERPARGRPSDTNSDATMVDEFAEAVLKGRAVWVQEEATWRVYADGVWAKSTIKEIREMFRLYVLEQLNLAARDQDVERAKMLMKYAQASKVKAIAELSEGRMRTKIEAFDRYHDLLVVGNGVVDLETGSLMPHDPSLMATKKTDTVFTPGATHQDWDTALGALPADCTTWLQVRIGQAITGHPTWDDMLPILQGGGANGKSSFIDGLQAALGAHMGMVSERILLARKDDHPTEMVDLRGMRLAAIEELPQDAPLNIKRLKDLLGTSEITARRIRENTVTWKATHSLFLTTNYIPRVLETDHGTWRRLALVKFPYRFVKEGKPLAAPEDRRGDSGLRPRLLAGLEGQHEAILAWCVEGAKAWYASGRAPLPLPATVQRDTDEWRTDADKIWGFIQDRMELDPEGQVLSTDLYAEFSRYLDRTGSAGWLDQTFATRLREHHLAHEHGIIKVRTRSLEDISRPGSVYQEFAEGQQATVWRGLRFAARPENQSVINLDEHRVR